MSAYTLQPAIRNPLSTLPPAQQADHLFAMRVNPNHPSRKLIAQAVNETLEERFTISTEAILAIRAESTKGDRDVSAEVQGKLFLSVLRMYRKVSPLISDKQFATWIDRPKNLLNLEAFLKELEISASVGMH